MDQPLPKLRSPKKGDSITAKLQQDIIKHLDGMQAKADPFIRSGHVKYRSPFTPEFSLESTTLYVSVNPSYVTNNQSELGTHQEKIPFFEGEPIVNPDQTDLTWYRPRKAITFGEWEMWLVFGVTSPLDPSAEIIVQETSADDPEAKPPWLNVLKIATWTVTDYSGTPIAENVIDHQAESIELNLTSYQPFEPILWHDGTNFKAKFEPAHVQPFDDNILNVTINGTSMTDNDGETVTAADEWWLQIDTDGDGVPTAADLAKRTPPLNNIVPDGNVTSGVFYYKICTFSTDGDYLIPEMHWMGNILWQFQLPSGGTFTPPWKVTDGGSGNAAIAAGLVMGKFLIPAINEGGWGTEANGPVADYQPETWVNAPIASYDGGSIATDAGVNYIYAEITLNGPTNAYAEAITDGLDTFGDNMNVNVELGDYMEPSDWDADEPGDTVTIVTSSDDPSLYFPTTGKMALMIAKVTNTSGTLTVEYNNTQNPEVFLPVVNVRAGN